MVMRAFSPFLLLLSVLPLLGAAAAPAPMPVEKVVAKVQKLYDGTTDFMIGNVNIPLGSGYTTVALVEALRTLKPDLGFLTVKAGHKLNCACLATMTAAKVMDVTWKGGQY